MKAALLIVLVVLPSLLCSTGLASGPTVSEASELEASAPESKRSESNGTAPAPVVTPATRLDFIKSCEHLVLRGLQMVLYRDPESGELATVKFEPNWSLGGKVGLTYRF